MIKLIVVTLAAFVAVLQVFGDSSRRPAQAPDAPEGLTLAALVTPAPEVVVTPEPQFSMSDEEAVALALEAGRIARSERASTPRLPRVGNAEAVQEVAEDQAETPSYWYVSGSRVNLRQGPGTGNAVVTQLTFGTATEVLERRGGWVQIRTAEGDISGWMSGKFLVDQRPG